MTKSPHPSSEDKGELLPVTQAISLKDRRERLGLTLRDVEEISKGAISNSYLSQLETGKIKSPSLENARILATIYHCQTDDIAEALSLPIPTVPFRCHCCGQSLLHAKFITDTRPDQSHSLPGDVATSPVLALVAGYADYQAISDDRWEQGKAAGYRELGELVAAALTPSALSGDAGEEGDEFNRGVLIAVSTLINCWGAGTETEHLLAMINADAAMIERMGFDDYDREPLLAALSSHQGAE